MELSESLLKQLSAIDTPTLSNAIEQLGVRNPVTGFSDRSLRCLFPELGTMCGYAVTAEADTTSPDPPSRNLYAELFEAVAAAPKPAVIVLREAGAHPELSAHCGEVMATTFGRLGGIGLISDSAVRDIVEVRQMGFHYFAPGAVASHGHFTIVRVGGPVTVCGLTIAPGDLLHGDVNGLIKVPREGVERLPDLADKVRETEQKFLEYVKSDAFRIEEIRKHLPHRTSVANLAVPRVEGG